MHATIVYQVDKNPVQMFFAFSYVSQQNNSKKF